MIDSHKKWEDFLNPDLMRSKLISASIYIASYESLKDSIIGHIRDFFWTGFNEKGDIIDPRYEFDVLRRNKSLLYASLNWLRENNVIDGTDMELFERIKECRNNLSHRLFSFLGESGLPIDFQECFEGMVALLRKIEVWWIAKVEIPTNPDYDGEEIDEAEIVPGPIIMIQLLNDIALGSEEKSRFYYDQFKKRVGTKDA
jgi:hypothetical protein